MYKFRTTFFQALLIILALAFTLAVRYAECTRTATVGAFGEGADIKSVTVSDMLTRVSQEQGRG